MRSSPRAILTLVMLAMIQGQACSARHSVRDRQQPKRRYSVTAIANQELAVLVQQSFSRHLGKRARALQHELLQLIAEDAPALGCFPYVQTQAARTVYDGQIVHVFAPADVSMPILPGTRFLRSADEEEIEAAAAADCRARIILRLGPEGGVVRLPGQEADAVAAYCSATITRNGVPERNYPDGVRTFIGNKSSDGRWALLRNDGRLLHGIRFGDVQRLRERQCLENRRTSQGSDPQDVVR